jgi:hypothetical protein
MVRAVVARPPSDGALDCAATEEGEGDLDGERGGVGGVGPESVVALFLLAFIKVIINYMDCKYQR